MKDNAAIQAAVERARLFADWPKEALAEIVPKFEARIYGDGEIATACGGDADGIWLVTEGAFTLTRINKDGRRFFHGYLMPGQATGFFPVFDGMPAAFDTTARGSATALYLPAAVLRDVMLRYPQVATEIVAYLCRRSRIDYERIEMLTMNSVRVRIAKIALYIAHGDLHSDQPEIVANLRISQDDIAGMVGATRQTANREIRKLIEEGVLKQRYGSLVIIDLPRLLAIAADDEDFSPIMKYKLTEPKPNLYQTSD